MTEKHFKIIEDYLIEYDGDYFDLHKPSAIRSLVNILNSVHEENKQLKTDEFSVILMKQNSKLMYANEDLKKENQQLKQRLVEKDDVEWLRNIMYGR